MKILARRVTRHLVLAGLVIGFGGLTSCGRTPESKRPIVPGTALSEQDFVPTLKATGAKWVVVSVSQAECGPCLTEALQLSDQQTEWQKQGVAIIGIGFDKNSDGVRRFYKHTGERVTYPLYFAPWFAESRKIEGTPVLFIFNTEGHELFRADAMETPEPVTAVKQKLQQIMAPRSELY